MNYTGQHALVLGLGESGLAMALWLTRCGASVRVADSRAAPQRLAELRQAAPEVEFIHAGAPFAAALLDGVDFVTVSPGLAPHLELAQIFPAAAEKNIPLWGEIELFAQALHDLRQGRGYQPKVIAITGTNGKTTVTSMVGLLCQRAGLSVAVAGNISPAALDVLRAALDADALPQAWVLELSSFQLHTTFSLQADAATVLNLSQDHLDWHGDMAAYAFDKSRIFGLHTVRVLNRDDPGVMRMAHPDAPMLTFGTDQAQAVGSFGLQNERGMVWLTVALEAEAGSVKKRRKNDPLPVPEAGLPSRLMPADALKIRGLHNASNVLAALALCRAIGLPFAPLLHGLREYAGEPHRVQLIAHIDGIEYYDDSKGTNVGATVAALTGLGKSFGGSGQRLVLIAGGEGKGQDFTPLAEPVARYVRAVLLIGRDAGLLRAALQPSGVDLIDCASLPLAVEQARTLAHSGDAVLLSPACASFDMFRDYGHRAAVFVDAVREIALAQGQEI